MNNSCTICGNTCFFKGKLRKKIGIARILFPFLLITLETVVILITQLKARNTAFSTAGFFYPHLTQEKQ